MKREAFFAAVDALPAARLSDVLGEGGAVIVAPHPDDESLGCGALILEAVAARRPVRIVFLSDGAKSHPNSEKSFCGAPSRASRERSAGRRRYARRCGVADRVPPPSRRRRPPVGRPGRTRFGRDRKRRRESSRRGDFCNLASRPALRSSGRLRNRARGATPEWRAAVRIFDLGPRR